MALNTIGVPDPNTLGLEPAGLQASIDKYFGRTPGVKPADPYDPLMTDAGARELLQKVRKQCEPGREAFEWGWWRILQYFLGRQWIYWNPSTRTWNDKRLARWVPKPVTNKVRETYDSIFALLADIQLGVNVRPVGQDPRNVIAAETADQMAPLIHDEHEMGDLMPVADFWQILLGNAYLHPHWDKDDPAHNRQIQLLMCQVCKAVVPPDVVQENKGRCPNCNSPAVMPAVGPDGQSVTDTVSLGRGKTLVVSPLELLMPLYAQSFKAVDRLIYFTWLPRHQVEDMVDKDVAAKIQWTQTPDQRSLQLYRALSMMSDLPMAPSTWTSAAQTGEGSEGCEVQYLWIKPCRSYPQGVYLPFYGSGTDAIPHRGQVSDEQGSAKPVLPYDAIDGTKVWPWVHVPYKPVAGRLFAQGAVDPILQKQDQLNQIDSMTQLVANRMGNPIWLEPKGSEVERFTGEPGLVVRYSQLGPNGAKPERIGGENPPQSFFALRQQYLGDIEDAAGTYDVVKGSKPSGVEAFSALQLLVERSQSRFTPVFKARGAGYVSWFKVAIELERKYGPTQRVHNVKGPNDNWTIQVFEQANLQGAIQVVAEDGSNVPKTALGRRAAIEHANQLGILAPMQNPDQLYAIHRELGTNNLMPSLDADVKSALQEQQAFEDWVASGALDQAMKAFTAQMMQYQQQVQANPAMGQMMPPPQLQSPLQRMPWHNDQVHYNENRKWMNGDRVRNLLTDLQQKNPQAHQAVVQLLGSHLMIHQQWVMQQQMMAQGGQPQDDGGEGQGAGRAMADSNRESGQAA